VTVKVAVGWALAGRARTRARARTEAMSPNAPMRAIRGRVAQRSMLSSRRGVCGRAARRLAPRISRSQTARQLQLEYRLFGGHLARLTGAKGPELVEGPHPRTHSVGRPTFPPFDKRGPDTGGAWLQAPPKDCQARPAARSGPLGRLKDIELDLVRRPLQRVLRGAKPFASAPDHCANSDAYCRL
jgi:hypothetical protein